MISWCVCVCLRVYVCVCVCVFARVLSLALGCVIYACLRVCMDCTCGMAQKRKICVCVYECVLVLCVLNTMLCWCCLHNMCACVSVCCVRARDCIRMANLGILQHGHVLEGGRNQSQRIQHHVVKAAQSGGLVVHQSEVPQ